MGYHCDNLYIGPAIKLSKAKHPMPENLLSCSNDACLNSKKHQNTQFCPNCGSPVIDRVIMKDRVVGLHDFIYAESGKHERWEDALFEPEYGEKGILLPNGDCKEYSAYYGDLDDKTVVIGERFPANMEKQKKAFETAFSEMMADMKEFGLHFEIVYVIRTWGS